MSIENQNLKGWGGIENHFRFEPFSEYVKKKTPEYDVNFLSEHDPAFKQAICEASGLEEQEAQKEYVQYLETIFPDSQVQEILWHNGNTKIDVPLKEKFSYSANIGSSPMNPTRSGFFASNAQEINFANVEGRILHAVKFDIHDPDHGDFSVHPVKVARDMTTDSAIVEYGGGSKFYAVFEPSQVHILGSKKDLEGFKKFIQEKKP